MEKNGNTIKNEDKKEFWIRKNAKIYAILWLLMSSW